MTAPASTPDMQAVMQRDRMGCSQFAEAQLCLLVGGLAS